MNNEQKQNELCPFCGGKAYFDKTVYKEVGVIRCQQCRATNGIITQEHSAIKAWNNRFKPTAHIAPTGEIVKDVGEKGISVDDIADLIDGYRVCDIPRISICREDAVEIAKTIHKALPPAISPIVWPEKTESRGYDHSCEGFCSGCHQDGMNEAITELKRLNPWMIDRAQKGK